MTNKYLEFEASGGAIKLALYPRRAAAKNAGVDPEGTATRRIVVLGDGGELTDPDGCTWESRE